jgi:hypothetical protein
MRRIAVETIETAHFVSRRDNRVSGTRQIYRPLQATLSTICYTSYVSPENPATLRSATDAGIPILNFFHREIAPAALPIPNGSPRHATGDHSLTPTHHANDLSEIAQPNPLVSQAFLRFFRHPEPSFRHPERSEGSAVLAVRLALAVACFLLSIPQESAVALAVASEIAPGLRPGARLTFPHRRRGPSQPNPAQKNGSNLHRRSEPKSFTRTL